MAEHSANPGGTGAETVAGENFVQPSVVNALPALPAPVDFSTGDLRGVLRRLVDHRAVPVYLAGE